MKEAFASRFDLRFFVLVSLVLLVVASGILLLIYSRETKQDLKDAYITELNNEYVITISVYSKMSDLIYHLNVDNDRVKKLFATGVKSSDPSVKNYYRKKLHSLLQDLYQKINSYNFRQFHFHEKNNRSFLRFHRPGKYGDDLSGVRSSVEYVNRESRYASGFEEGRIFNGYRFIYPVEYYNEHIGSVEVSVSIESVIDELKQRFGKKAQFIIFKDLVEKKVFKSELSNYISWPVDNRFVMDRAVGGKCILENRISQKDAERIKKILRANVEKCRPFCVEVGVDRNPVMITFLPVRNFAGKCAAYIFSMSDNRRMQKERRAFLVIFTLLSILFIMLMVFSLYYRYSQKKIESMATYDFLTGIFSREVLFQRLDAEFERYKRYLKPFSVIMIDIDHFKSINDSHGHSTGDIVLSAIGEIFRNNIRKTDAAGRYGGEEFVVVLPETDLNEAVTVAENLRQLVSAFDFHRVGRVTVSCGVAVMNHESSSIEELVNKADERLYMAKQQGRNRVINKNVLSEE